MAMSRQTSSSSSSSIFASDYSLTPTQSRDPPPRSAAQLGVSPTKTSPFGAGSGSTPRAMPSSPSVGKLGSPMPSSSPTIPRHRGPEVPGNTLRTKGMPVPQKARYDTYPACMEAGLAHEARSQALGHTGTVSERHLRTAASLFESALSLQASSWTCLRLATVLYHLAPHCRPFEGASLLRRARTLVPEDAGPAIETRAAICARLSALLRLPGDTLDSEAGEMAAEALYAFEEVAGDRMDRAQSLSKADFEAETPALAATFLALAEAASAVCTLSSDVEEADAHAELTDHALSHAANMATLLRAPALVTHIQLTSARLTAERLRFYSRLEGTGAGDGWDDLLAELGMLASQTRNVAHNLRGSRGAAAAEQAAEAAKLLADTRVMYASCLPEFKSSPPQSHSHHLPKPPDSARSAPTPPITPLANLVSPITPITSSDYSLSPFLSNPTPGLSSSSGSWSSASTGSPPIPEEPEKEDAAGHLPTSSSFSTSPTSLRKRAPPPPPLQLHRRPPSLPAFTPINHPAPLSPLNPARRASDLPARPKLVRGPSFSVPRRATWTPELSPITPRPLTQWNQLASAGKGYKLALSLLSRASLPQAERARRKSELLFAVATTALARAEIAPHMGPRLPPTPSLPAFHRHLSQSPPNSQGLGLGLGLSHQQQQSQHSRSAPGYFSPMAPHATYESLRSLHKATVPARNPGHVRAHSFPRFTGGSRIAPATPRPDLRSGTRTTGAAALRVTAEVYAAWAAREVGWSAALDPKGAGADRRTGVASADEAGLKAVLLAVRVWWVRARAGDELGEVDEDGNDDDEAEESKDSEEGRRESKESEEGRRESDEKGDEKGDMIQEGKAREEPRPKVPNFGLPPPTARRIAATLARLRAEGAGADDLRRFTAPLVLRDDERRFWDEVEAVLAEP